MPEVPQQRNPYDLPERVSEEGATLSEGIHSARANLLNRLRPLLVFLPAFVAAVLIATSEHGFPPLDDRSFAPSSGPPTSKAPLEPQVDFLTPVSGHNLEQVKALFAHDAISQAFAAQVRLEAGAPLEGDQQVLDAFSQTVSRIVAFDPQERFVRIVGYDSRGMVMGDLGIQQPSFMIVTRQVGEKGQRSNRWIYCADGAVYMIYGSWSDR